MTYVLILTLGPLLLGLIVWIGSSQKLVWQEPFIYPEKKEKGTRKIAQVEQPLLYPGIAEEIIPEEYGRFVLCHKVSLEEGYQMIQEFGKLAGEEEQELFTFGFAEHREWIVIRTPENFDTHAYHDLVNWLSHSAKDLGSAAIVLGYACHKTDLSRSYVLRLDEHQTSGAILLGDLKSGQAFFHDLWIKEPNRQLVHFYEKGANSSPAGSSRNEGSFKVVGERLTRLQMNFSDLSSLELVRHQIALTPMW